MLIRTTGKRLLALSGLEVLNYAYAVMVDGLDTEKRKELEVRLNTDPNQRLEDPYIPERLKRLKPPDWWVEEHDPFAKTFSV